MIHESSERNSDEKNRFSKFHLSARFIEESHGNFSKYLLITRKKKQLNRHYLFICRLEKMNNDLNFHSFTEFRMKFGRRRMRVFDRD